MSVAHTALIMLTGVATAIPLLFFAAGAPRVPLSTMGLLQYLAPAMQFVLGLTLFGEPMPAGRLVGLALAWVALSVFSVDLLRHRRVRACRPAEALAVP